MQTTRANALPRRLLAGALLIAFTLAACAGAAAPTASPGPAATPKPTPTAVPGEPGNTNGVGTDPGTGGGSDPGQGGGGIVIPIPQDPNQNPLFGPANYLVPAPGLLNPRAMNVQLVRAIFPLACLRRAVDLESLAAGTWTISAEGDAPAITLEVK